MTMMLLLSCCCMDDANRLCICHHTLSLVHIMGSLHALDIAHIMQCRYIHMHTNTRKCLRYDTDLPISLLASPPPSPVSRLPPPLLPHALAGVCWRFARPFCENAAEGYGPEDGVQEAPVGGVPTTSFRGGCCLFRCDG